jgi:rubrerythrin
MDIYEYAMQMEKDGEKFYRELAAKTSSPGIKNILTMLADAEVKHYNLFQNMKNNEKIGSITDTSLLENVKNVFVKLREEKQFEAEVPELDLYKKAQEIEKKSRDFYLEKAGEVTDDSQKTALKKIADEEHRHFNILENIITLVNRPNIWLEDPEWYHLEEY